MIRHTSGRNSTNMSVERVLRDRLGGHIGAAVAMNTAEAQYFDTNIDLKDSTLPINIYFLRNSCIFRIIDLRYDHPVGLSKHAQRTYLWNFAPTYAESPAVAIININSESDLSLTKNILSTYSHSIKICRSSNETAAAGRRSVRSHTTIAPMSCIARLVAIVIKSKLL